MNKYILLVSLVWLQLEGQIGFAQKNPFPQGESFQNVIKPNHKTQNSLNNDVGSYYDYWKGKYLKTASSGGYYIAGEATGGSGKGTSEGHGYGMIITALMSGYDIQAKTYYDGLFEFFDNHRSTSNNELMGWLVDFSESSNSYTSAADGDLDIAYSLILAHYQWGSEGTIDYLKEAKDMINNGVRADLVNSFSNRIMQGDWDNSQYTTRSSDWMVSHLHAFEFVTGDPSWNNVRSEITTMSQNIYQNYSPTTGLMPDFVHQNVAVPDPDAIEVNSEHYSWNACRTPWRLAQAKIHYGQTDFDNQLNTFVTWAKTEVGVNGTNFGNYASGYTLSGSSIGGRSGSAAYLGPLLVASSINGSNQTFLNNGWTRLSNSKTTYFDDSINMLCMLLISGNWWVPNEPDCEFDCENGNCLVGFGVNGIYENFEDVEEPTTSIGGVYFWGEPELAGDDNPNFQAILTRDFQNQKLSIDATQGQGEYFPFGLSFGDDVGDGSGVANTIDISSSKTMDLSLENTSTETIKLTVSLLDANGNLLNTYATADPQSFGTAWEHEIGIVLSPGQNTNFTVDFTGGYYANYDAQTLDQNIDFSQIATVLFVPLNTLNSGAPNWEPLEISNVGINFHSMSLGDCTSPILSNKDHVLSESTFYVFPTTTSEFLNVHTNEQTRYRVFNAIGEVVLEGDLNGLEDEKVFVGDLKSGVYYIQNASSTVSQRFILN